MKTVSSANKWIRKIGFYSRVLVSLGLVFLIIPQAAAISPEQKKLFQSGISFFDAKEDECSTSDGAQSFASGLPSGSKVYMVGSSTSTASFAMDELQAEIPKAGYVINKINADGGRSLSVDTVGNDPTAIQAVADDQEIVKNSDAVIVAIFNEGGDWDTDIPAMVNQIRQANGSAKIYWATFFTADKDEYNKKIIGYSKSLSYNVIDTANAGIVISSDNIHPTPDGQLTFARAIANGLKLSSTGSSSLYVLGDSITVGMRDSGKFGDKLSGSGWTPTKINAVNGKTVDWGIEQAQTDSETISQSQSVLIGLGTNNIADVATQTAAKDGGKDRLKEKMQRLVDSIRLANPDVKIYWTNVYMTGKTEEAKLDRDIAMPIINQAISEVASPNRISIVPWGTSAEAKQYTSSDGLHPYAHYPEMAQYIVGQLNNLAAGARSTVPSDCKCTAGSGSLVGADNPQQAFNFFVGKGYSKEWAAGIIGNMINEGGVNPIRMQGVFSKDAKFGVDINLLEEDGGVRLANFEAAAQQVAARNPDDSMVTINGVGWGIVQWTPASQIIDTGRAEGKSDTEIESLAYQVEFVWRQLEGTISNVSRKSAGDELKKTTTPEDAAFAFGRYYERFNGSRDPNHPSYAKRKSSARSVYDNYGNQTVASGSTLGGCGSSTAGKNGWDLPGEGNNAMVYYSQLTSGNDPAVTGYFGNSTYGPGKISACGCGPTSWAMVVSTLTGKQVTPDQVANWVVLNGMQNASDSSGCGGSRWWWQEIPGESEKQWGVRARTITLAQADDYILQGKLVIASVGPGSVLLSSGSSGHILVMRAVTDDGKFLFADPSDSQGKRGDHPILSPLGSSRTPLDAATVDQGLKALFVVEKI